MTYPTLGKMAPNFSLPDQYGNIVSLKDFKKKSAVMIFFYPKALTPGCTVQACGMRDIKVGLESKGAIILGISPDPVERLLRFSDKYKLNFPLLSDSDHQVAEKYGCWGLKKFMGKEFMGLIRTSFFVSKDGRLLKVINKFTTKTHHEVLLRELTEN